MTMSKTLNDLNVIGFGGLLRFELEKVTMLSFPRARYGVSTNVNDQYFLRKERSL